MEKINELQAVIDELKILIESAKLPRSKKLINDEINKIEKEIESLASIKANATRKMATELSQYAFDESEKYVKIYIPFETKNLEDESIDLKISDKTLSITITDGEKNYSFNVNSLLFPIDSEKSYKKIKSDMIAVFLKKVKENVTWKFLTSTEKQLKEKKDKMFENDNDDEIGKDPNGALMNIMKKMYETGDSEMKRTIQKAWVEGQEKKMDINM